ncbi:hypothetical protein HRED_07364 [Candidatus Haloredivivus sp. G17]|nr:hypothetical protein HRED_07364 [Candidatus Haloredivivus sp. G17]
MPKLFANLALIFYAGYQIGLTPNLLTITYAAFSMMSGMLVAASIYLLFSSTAFWTGTSRNAVWLIFRLSNFRKYPIEIFALVIQGLLVTLIPLAFASFFPASYILGKEGFETWKIITPFIGPVFFYVAYRFWNLGLGNYSKLKEVFDQMGLGISVTESDEGEANILYTENNRDIVLRVLNERTGA